MRACSSLLREDPLLAEEEGEFEEEEGEEYEE